MKFVVKINPYFIALSALVIGAGGCGLSESRRQAALIENQAPIEGLLVADTATPAPVYIALLRRNGDYYEYFSRLPASSNRQYTFNVLPGTYLVGAFVDSNRDGVYQADESATYLGIEDRVPTALTIASNDSIKPPDLSITGPIEKPVVSAVARRSTSLIMPS